jgi:putative ABC transport system permease protein
LRKQLLLQFAGEALLLSILSLVLALVLIDILLPAVNSFLGKELSLQPDSLLIGAALIFFLLGAGLLSSVYPAFFLARINPATALKKETTIGNRRISLRKILVVVQFSISIIMITATIIIYLQLRYLQDKELGFDVDNLLVVDINSANLRQQFESIKQEFKNLSQVQSVTVSSRVPGEWKVFPIANVQYRQSGNKEQMIFVGADEDFLGTFNIPLLIGRNLRNDPADSNSILLSESAVKALGLKDPLGKTVDINSTIWAGDLDERDDLYRPVIVGVIRDFYFQSFREKQIPVMLASYHNPIHQIDYYTLRIRTNDWAQVIGQLEAINYRFDPENPLEYNFLDARFADFYQGDQIRGRLFLIFSGLIILIACMGLFALASFSIENRIKEIGIRKVLGARIAAITWLISAEFALLVGFAFIVAAPLAYWMIQNWLEEFAYRVTIPWWAFPAAGLAALLIALTTVSFQAIRAANANPVKALRYE